MRYLLATSGEPRTGGRDTQALVSRSRRTPDAYCRGVNRPWGPEEIAMSLSLRLAGALLALVPSLVVYLSLQKSFLRGITTGAIKG